MRQQGALSEPEAVSRLSKGNWAQMTLLLRFGWCGNIKQTDGVVNLVLLFCLRLSFIFGFTKRPFKFFWEWGGLLKQIQVDFI